MTNIFFSKYWIAHDTYCTHKKSVFFILIFQDKIISYIYGYSSHFIQHLNLNKSRGHNLRELSKIQNYMVILSLEAPNYCL